MSQLDNPIWHALTGAHASHAVGGTLARHYPRDISPFSGIAEASGAAYLELRHNLPVGVEARLFRPAFEAAPSGWSTTREKPIVQMVYQKARDLRADYAEVVQLGAGDANEMVMLSEVANPGSFGRNAYRTGTYFGVRRNGKLVAMGGTRFVLDGLVELASISVDPVKRGHGLGTTIVAALVAHVLRDGQVPFLHVFPENPAIGLYEKLGFEERVKLWVFWRVYAEDKSP